MPSLATLAYWEAVVLLGGLAGVVSWQIATGQISLAYLLEGDVRDPNSPDGFSSRASAGRAQALAITLFVAAYYLIQVFRSPQRLPDVPASLVGTLAASHAAYLGSKIQDMRANRTGK
jgi:hypothetical protein